jgi:uncharacterized membrane protein
VVGADAPGAGTDAGGPPVPSPGAGAALSRGFVWTEAGGMVYLPAGGLSLYPNAINAAGVVAGTGVVGTRMSPVAIDPAVDTQPRFLGAAGQALGINDSGQVTGIQTWIEGNRTFRATGALVETLPDLAGEIFSEGNAIDGAGTVVGSGYCVSVNSPGCKLTGGEAVRIVGAGGIEDLNDLVAADSGWILRSANATTADGQHIVGWGLHSGVGRAFRLTPAPDGTTAEVLDLGITPDLPAGAANVVIAHDINAAGEIAGAVYDPEGQQPQNAFIWVAGTGLVDLNDFVDPLSGWHLAAAYGLNDSRDVVGYGTLDGQVRAFKMRAPDLRPCPGADSCHVATRDLRTGACPVPTLLADIASCRQGITLRFDGVVDAGNNHFVAVFGYDSSATTIITPATNQVRVDGTLVTAPVPLPPSRLPPGAHAGSYLAHFDSGHTISWTVDGQTVTASASGAFLPTIPIGTGGIGVQIGGTSDRPRPGHPSTRGSDPHG